MQEPTEPQSEDTGGRRLTVRWFALIGLALLAMGLVLGIAPGNAGDVQCGSPFFSADSGPGDEEECALAGGLAERRAWALALVAGGMVFLAAAYKDREPRQGEPRAPRHTLANRAAPGLRKAEAASASAEAASAPAETDASP